MKLLNDFFEREMAGGIVLVACAVLSMFLANSAFQQDYIGFWKLHVFDHPLDHWVNDGLMAIFFLLIGLELKRELYHGELSTIKTAMLPVFAAIGGMLVPAGLYLWLNYGTPTQAGAGIPMATDIVFALGALSLLGKRIPVSLRIFLTALATIDDLGAILTIAIFYAKGGSLLYLGIAAGIFAGLLLLNRLKVQHVVPYLIGGAALWYFMLHSGIHATIAGVLLAFAIPIGRGDAESTSFRLQHALHRPVTFLIVPIFVLANTAISVHGSVVDTLASSNGLGIFIGLFIGKPVGIFLCSLLAVRLGFSVKPAGISWSSIAGVGLLGGIGFTMSIFVTLLAFNEGQLSDMSKLVIMISSAISGISGLALLRFALPGKSRFSTED